MKTDRLTGPGAGARKYDLITAISVIGLAGSASEQTTMLRLIAIITARYNWFKDEIAMGQREMAAIWSVDERTAKREVKRLLSNEILINIRPGVRGRVAAYRLNTLRILELGAGFWHRVGADFATRMSADGKPENANVVRVDFRERESRQVSSTCPLWQKVFARLDGSDPELAAAWFAQLDANVEQDCMKLVAPSAFHADYVRTHFMDKIRHALRAESAQQLRLEVIGVHDHPAFG